MLNHPDTDVPPPSSGKLVLPDLSGEEQRIASGQHRAQIHPGLLIRQTTPPTPKKLLPKLAWYWRKDPAYKVFMIAIALVVVASIVFVSLLSTALFGRSSSVASFSQTPPVKVTPGGKVDLHPTFSAPGGGHGTGQSSQPPAQNTPSTGPTSTAQPTVQPGGPNTLQIINYPQTVSNNSVVDVTVSANQPGVSIYLQIRYTNAFPAQTRTGARTTDGSGTVTLSWSVQVFSFGHKHILATLTAIGIDQNGQTFTSDPVVVQVASGPGVP